MAAGPLEIPRVCDISVEDFINNHLQRAKPLIIENPAKSWPCMAWTIDSLKEKVGENLVHVRRNTSCEDYKVGKKYNIDQIKFSAYIDDLLADNKRARNSYLAVQNIKQAFPELQKDVPIPHYVGKLHAGPFMWMARANHYEFCHFDPDDNLLVMVCGRKRVRLYGSDLRTMYPNPLGSKGRTIQSRVNCQLPDMEMFPDFSDAVCYECILKPGDMLFFPAFWWHQVTSLDISISINMFFGDAGTNNYLTKILTPPWSEGFHYWFLNIIEQNRETPSFPRLLAELPGAVHNFLITQWKEYGTEEQINELVQLAMKHCGVESLPALERTSNNAKKLKIRGLLWRK